MSPMSKTGSSPLPKIRSESVPVKAAKFFFLPVLCALPLVNSCLSPLKDVAFISPGETVSGEIVYSFTSAAEGDFFRTVMHPEGSSAPRGRRFRKKLCAVVWRKPDGSKVYALWNAKGEKLRVPLRSSGNIFGCFESGGKKIRLELSGGKVYAVLSGKVLYIHGSSDFSAEIPDAEK